jgi:hypothetical protein
VARADWQFLPVATLEKQKRDEDAAAWAAAQRKVTAQQWADAHLADFRANLPEPAPMPPGPFSDPHLQGLSGGPEDPGTSMPVQEPARGMPDEPGVLGFDSAKTAGRIEENAAQVQADEPSNVYPTSLGDAFKRGMDQGTGQAPDIPPLRFGGPVAPYTPSKPTQPPQDVTDKIVAGEDLGPEDFSSTLMKATGNQGTSQVFDEGGPRPQVGPLPTPTAPGGGVLDRIGGAVGDAARGIGSVARAAGSFIENRVNEAADEERATNAASRRVFEAYQRGEEPDPADYRRTTESALNVAMGVSGAGPEAAGPVGAATAKIGRAAEQELARLRLDKFPEAVRDTIRQAAESGEFWRTQRRGVIPDDQAEKMADDLGLSVDKIIAGGKAAKAYSTEETRAVRNALVAQGVKVNEIGEQIAQAGPHGVTDQMLAEQIAEGAKLVDLSRVAEGARSEAGRTLRAYQAFARDYAADPASATQRIVKAVGGREAAVQAVDEFNKLRAAGADAFKMADFWAKVEKPPPGFTDWFALLRYNAMLSGPRTLEVNVIGNAAEVPWRLARDTAASVLRGRPQEMGPEVAGMVEGARKGIGSFMDVLAHGVTLEQAAAGEIPRSVSSRVRNPVARGAARALELPGNVLQAADEFARQTAYGMGLGRWAATTASREGLRGGEWGRRVEELLANPTVEAMKGAEAIAERMTYKGQMGSLGQGIEGFRAKTGVVGNVVVPFLRTVYHITSRGIDRSPLGAVGTAVDVARGVYGKPSELKGALSAAVGPRPGVVPLGERLSDNVVGSAAFAGLALAAANGYVTGAGPEDREKRDMLKAQGWQPYSVKLGDRWVSYSNWGPIAVPLSLAAGLHEGKDLPDAFARGAKVLTEQAYLSGVGTIWKGMTEPDRYGEQWVAQALQTLVPYGAAINTVGQATDPYLRDPGKTTVAQLGRGEVPNTLKARIPGVRENLPALQDQLGRDVANPQRGAAAVLPVRASESAPDPALRELQRVGVDVPEPPKEVRGIPLTPEEQRAFNRRAGELIRQRVAARTSDPGWGGRTPEARVRILKAAVESARTDAGNEIVNAIPGKNQRRETAKTAATAKQLAGATP